MNFCNCLYVGVYSDQIGNNRTRSTLPICNSPVIQIALKIKSKDTELDIAPQETHTTTPLNHSLISSIKEK